MWGRRQPLNAIINYLGRLLMAPRTPATFGRFSVTAESIASQRCLTLWFSNKDMDRVTEGGCSPGGNGLRGVAEDA